jgi:hypothetical protein
MVWSPPRLKEAYTQVDLDNSVILTSRSEDALGHP